MKTGIIRSNGRKYVQITCHPAERTVVSAVLNSVELGGRIKTYEVTVCIETFAPNVYLKQIRGVWKSLTGVECDLITEPVREPIASIADLIERRKVDGFNINMMEIASRHTKPGDAIDGAMWLMGALEALAQDGYITTEEYDGLMKAL